MATLDRAQTTRRKLLEELPPEMRQALCSVQELQRRRCGELRAERLPTGVPALDRLLGGGLPRGELVELVGRGSCGRLAALLEALRAATSAGEVAALVDLGFGFDPQGAENLGVELERLLWLRPRRLPEALSAAETAASTGFPLVVVDLGLPPVPGRAPLAAWLRLARSASDHQAAVLASSPYHLSGCAAATVLSLSSGHGRWAGAATGPRLLAGLESRVGVTRRRGHRPTETDELSLAFPGSLLPSPAPTLQEVRHVAVL
jgi:hypothetical protein